MSSELKTQEIRLIVHCKSYRNIIAHDRGVTLTRAYQCNIPLRAYQEPQKDVGRLRPLRSCARSPLPGFYFARDKADRARVSLSFVRALDWRCVYAVYAFTFTLKKISPQKSDNEKTKTAALAPACSYSYIDISASAASDPTRFVHQCA